MSDKQPIIVFQVGQIVCWYNNNRNPIEITALMKNEFKGRDIMTGDYHNLIYTHPNYHWFLVDNINTLSLPEEMID